MRPALGVAKWVPNISVEVPARRSGNSGRTACAVSRRRRLPRRRLRQPTGRVDRRVVQGRTHSRPRTVGDCDHVEIATLEYLDWYDYRPPPHRRSRPTPSPLRSALP
jgi:hypothetical protein